MIFYQILRFVGGIFPQIYAMFMSATSQGGRSMDQIKTGKFISQMRKEKSLTQRQLADELNISDKTVSKWECGNGFPEVSLMLPLCEVLNVSVNELFSGEKLTDAEYKKKAEENIMDLIKEKEESKKKVALQIVVMIISVVSFATLLVTAIKFAPSTLVRIILLVIGAVVFVAGISVACVLDRETGVYECRKCGAKFTPDMKSYVAGAHTITTRYLKCPECGKSSYCKHRLSH